MASSIVGSPGSILWRSSGAVARISPAAPFKRAHLNRIAGNRSLNRSLCICCRVEDESNSRSIAATIHNVAASTVESKSSSNLSQEEAAKEQIYTFNFRYGGAVTGAVALKNNVYEVVMATPVEGMTLHWAVNNWALPNSSWWPPGSSQATDQAIETSFLQKGPNGAWEIRMRFPTDGAPRCMVFVLKDKDGVWYNNNGCFQLPLKAMEFADLKEQIVIAETTFEHWSLFNRFILAAQLLDAAESIGPNGMALLFTWLRFSATKQLAWYRNCNYQSKDIASVQEKLASVMAAKACHGKDSLTKRLSRMILATLPRGGGDAEQIRMGILNIMREHGIREGHRPGIEDRFLEQWHQKLHTNTTPEDIHICEAYLHFLHTNNIDDFYRTLWNNGRISKEWLETMDHPITAHPLHLPQLIPAFQHFLWILKTVHSGADLDVMVEMTKGYFENDLRSILYNILGNRDAWWLPGELLKARKQLEKVWRGDSTQRDVLLLDIALDNFFGICIARTDKSALSGDDLCELVSLVLDNCCIDAESEEFNMCLAYWNKVKAEKRWTQPWGLLALAAVDRVSLAVEEHMDQIYKLIQPHAETLGSACRVDSTYINNFGEEVVRGQVLFNLSLLLQKLQPLLRESAGVSPWQVISYQPSAHGTVLVLPSLASIQGCDYSTPQIVLTDQVDGMEDIPVGVSAVLCAKTVDMLSHVAIRARDSQVLLASCYKKHDFEKLKSYADKSVQVNIDQSGNVVVSESIDNEMVLKAAKVKPLPPEIIGHKALKFALPEDEFQDGNVGGKSLKIAMLRKRLGKFVLVPPSVALPLGVFEEVIRDPLNSSIGSALEFSLQRLKTICEPERIRAELATIRDLVASKLVVPVDLRSSLADAADSSGLMTAEFWESDENWARVWRAIRQVWASKWTDRAWLSRRARGIPEDSLYMGCLLQKIVPADYAFVIHTVHPVTKDPDVMFVEIVVGLGEVLVGNHKGSALSFSVRKDNLTEASFVALPSKRVGLFSHGITLIARSDSNGEDLEGFAGAGLYDSVIVEPPKTVMLDYNQERLLWDTQFRDRLVQTIGKLAVDVEAAFDGQAQDIEGVFSCGNVALVQSRPQVIL